MAAIDHNDVCYCCDEVGELLCCSTCNSAFHLECTRPTLSAVPEDEWSCAYCVGEGTEDNIIMKNSVPPTTKEEAMEGMRQIEEMKKKKKPRICS